MAVGQYLESIQAAEAVEELITADNDELGREEIGDNSHASVTNFPPKASTLKIRVRTARRWLAKLGFEWKEFRKGVYKDGHERPDVVAYRNSEFLPQFESIRVTPRLPKAKCEALCIYVITCHYPASA